MYSATAFGGGVAGGGASGGPGLYVAAYRPRRSEASDTIELWPMPLALGRALPTAPLALRNLATVLLDLEATYAATCEDSRF